MCPPPLAVPQKLRIELPYDPAIPLLGIYLKNLKTFICKNVCTAMFLAAVFMVAKTCEQPDYPSIDDWLKKMWYVHTMTRVLNTE